MTEDRDMKQNAAFLVAALKASNLKEGFPGGSVVRNLPANAGDLGSILGWKDPREKGIATHSSILAWRIP